MEEMRWRSAGKAAEREGKAMPGDNATKALRAQYSVQFVRCTEEKS